jgi:NAD(P)-dependent dehydrogenase (short-subunit alcohol dehydrogenase family)
MAPSLNSRSKINKMQNPGKIEFEHRYHDDEAVQALDGLGSFNLTGKVAMVTGGTGVLGGAIAVGLARAGAKVAILGRRTHAAEATAAIIREFDADSLPLIADVLDVSSLEAAKLRLLKHWDHLDVLVNCAGGNVSDAIVVNERTFFNLRSGPLEQVVDLNLHGTLRPTQVFGEIMARQRTGSIINISSMSAQKPLTRVVGYSMAKAAVENFTKWLAVDLAKKYGEGLRVNAIAPGFFLGQQNRTLLVNEDQSPTTRGQTIIDHTPMGRFGEPDDLVGTAIWLSSDAARFVTGVVVPVDGGFSAFGGV